ncbi:MAG: DNA topoisomerase III [Clostridiales bacterium]|nr:DNA topoisomerase III [Clostridiales bacterium]
MSKTLVLAEKPSVGRELARVLGCQTGGAGYLEGSRYIVTWALGHLVTLAEPEKYGEQYKTWNMESLPIMPEKMELVVIPESARQFGVVKKLLHDPRVDNLVIATDAGREGELVARWILQKAGCQKPIKRLWISSQTDRAIRQGFNDLKDGRLYDSLYRSAQARAEADWLVGFNVTRALTVRHNAQLSGGRVQTPTLALIVRREDEIRKFIPKDYWLVRADLGKFFATWKDGQGKSQISDRSTAEALAEKIKGANFRVTDIRRTPKSTPPPALYDLTELQRDANKLYGFSAKDTLNIMQRLYEQYHALTYPRTDSRYLPADVLPTMDERLQAVAVGEFAPLVRELRTKHAPLNRACINDAKVTDHHAIIPTEERADTVRMTSEEKKIYMLVVKRFLANFYSDYRFETIRAELTAMGESFSSQGRIELDTGWRAVERLEDEEEADEQVLPTLAVGNTFLCENVQLKAQKTAPPARYTEASLLADMENPAKYIKDTELRGYIGGGLGTPATRADIIEKLQSAFYVEKRGTTLIPTSKGIQLIQIVPSELREPLLTAAWERKLEGIRDGSVRFDGFVKEIRGYTKELVKRVAEDDVQYVHDNLTRTPCPKCGKMMLEVKGKRGTMLVCQDRTCGERISVSLETNARCPECRKKLELFGEGEKRTYVCRCGFRERADKFRERYAQAGASKAAVREYMKQQERQQPQEESAFAIALRKAMEQQR